MDKTIITVETRIKAPIETVWAFWTKPEHITNWNFATDEWCCPSAVNDLRPGGELNWRMEAKDGSMGFDFKGTYEQIKINELIAYKIADGRKVTIRFSVKDGEVTIEESFEAEEINSEELQRTGWQAILENFRNYVNANIK